jgi:hypothetical protein
MNLISEISHKNLRGFFFHPTIYFLKLNYVSEFLEKISTEIEFEIFKCKINTMPILMHPMRISPNKVSSGMLRPKKFGISSRASIDVFIQLRLRREIDKGENQKIRKKPTCVMIRVNWQLHELSRIQHFNRHIEYASNKIFFEKISRIKIERK